MRKTKIAFFQRFHSYASSPERCTRTLRGARGSMCMRQLRLRESMRYETLRRGRISAPHKPDCANLRELRPPIRRSQRRHRGVATYRNRHSRDVVDASRRSRRSLGRTTGRHARVDTATRETAHAHLEARAPPTAFAGCTRAIGGRSRADRQKNAAPVSGRSVDGADAAIKAAIEVGGREHEVAPVTATQCSSSSSSSA
jgi:hypothetical protein